ncbi:Parvalbumin [Parasponia andersonii]|uniref:Parvalbumin n=1 Tax=Parasponia andersonii TaxID=3476 RepID=A0A2P5BEU0_PARAD|nr:Parvalbumin [Parasponia andersonii]
MSKGDSSDSESEEATEKWSSDEPETKTETPANNGKSQKGGASEYEKQRLSRIAENRARMEALGLPKMASSLMGSPHNSRKTKGKAKVTEEDEDYRPQEEEPTSSGDDEEENTVDVDEDYKGAKSSRSHKRKVKNKVSKYNKKVPVLGKVASNSDYMDEDDALKLAIALSLQYSGEPSQSPNMANSKVNAKRIKTQTQHVDKRNKGKKSFASRLQMTEDELLVHYYQFDDNWKGGISVKDLERVATAHDFTWTDQELADMIRCFDSDGDGKLNLDDFRKIAVRCHMIKEESQDEDP